MLCQLSYSHRRKLIITSTERLQTVTRTADKCYAMGSLALCLNSPDAYVFEAQGAQTGRVEQVLCVDDEGFFE